jgi:hypothetical protein
MAEENYLGLGVVFKGVDDGFSKTLGKATKRIHAATDALDSLKKSINVETGGIDPSQLGTIESAESYVRVMGDVLQNISTDMKRSEKLISSINTSSMKISNALAVAGDITVDTAAMEKMSKSIQNISEGFFGVSENFDKLVDSADEMRFIADVFGDFTNATMKLSRGLVNMGKVSATFSSQLPQIADAFSAMKHDLYAFSVSMQDFATIDIDSLLTSIEKIGFLSMGVNDMVTNFSAMGKSLEKFSDTAELFMDLSPTIRTVVKELMKVSGLTGEFPIPEKETSDAVTAYMDAVLSTIDALSAFAVEKDKIILNLAKLDRQMNGTSKIAAKFRKSMEDIGQTTMTLRRRFQLLVKSGFGLKPLFKFLTADLIKGLQPITEFMIGTGKTTEAADQFDLLGQKMKRVFAPGQVKGFIDNMTRVAAETATSGAQMNTLATAMNEYGIDIKTANKLLPTMGNLVGVMGEDAQAVGEAFGRMTSQLNMGPEAIDNLHAEIVKMGRSHGFVKFTEYLPEVMTSVTKSMARLRDVNEDNARATSKSVFTLGTMFRKMGVGAQEAMGYSQSLQERFTDLALSFERAVAGVGGSEMETLNRFASDYILSLQAIGAKDIPLFSELPAKFAEMAKTPDVMMKELATVGNKLNQQVKAGDKNAQAMLHRLKKMVGDVFGPAGEQWALAMDRPDLMAKIQKDLKNAAESANTALSPKEIREQTFAMQKDSLHWAKESLRVNREMVDALKELTPIFKSAFTQSRKAAVDRLKGIQEEIRKQTAIGFTMTFAAIIDQAGASGAAFALGFEKAGKYSAQIAMDMEQVEKAVKPLAKLGSAFGGIQTIITGLIGALTGGVIGKGVSLLTSGFGKFADKLKPVGNWMRTANTKMITFGRTINDKVYQGFSRVSGFLKGKIGPSLTNMTTKMGKFGAFVKGPLSGGFGKLLGILGKFAGPLGAIISFIPDAIGGIKKMTEGKIGEGIADTLIGDMKASVASQAMKWGGVGASIGMMMGGPAGAAIGGVIGAALGGAMKKAEKVTFGWLQAQESLLLTHMKSLEGAAKGLKPGESLEIDPDEVMDRGWFAKWLLGESAKIKLTVPTKRSTARGEPVADKADNLTAVGSTFQEAMEGKAVSPAVPVTGLANQVSASPVAATPYIPTFEAKERGKNTTDDVVSALVDLRDMMQKELGNVSERPVDVRIEGDVKKFFRAVQSEGRSRYGSRGGSSVVGGNR